ncbi:MAG TPA: thymidylate synthase [Dehalococcoidia bacterium]|nr:thymidylate synthase [Dehalococcoidia bacterium]
MRLARIESRDIPEAWFRCLKEVLEHGHEYTVARGSGNVGQRRKELDFVTVHIHKPGMLPLIPDVPPGVPPPTSMDYVEGYVRYLMTGERQPGEEYTYGEYLESQIDEVIRMYREEGFDTNQACMQVGDKDSIRLQNPPCLRVVDTRVRYGALHFFLVFRSWDLWAGFPSNLAALQLVKKYMADMIGVEDGEMVATTKGLHLYDYSWELAQSVVYR